MSWSKQGVPPKRAGQGRRAAGRAREPSGPAAGAGRPPVPAALPKGGAAERPPIAVLYEDPLITICIKPSGISSEELPASPLGRPGPCASMPALLRARWGAPTAYVGVVHRLDTGVSGVMVYARTPKAAAALSAQIQARSFEKEYRCVCLGVPAPAAGEMSDFLFRDSRQGKVFPVNSARRGAKQARLAYRVLSSAVLPRSGGTADVQGRPLSSGTGGAPDPRLPAAPPSEGASAGGSAAHPFAAGHAAEDVLPGLEKGGGPGASAISPASAGEASSPPAVSLCRVRLYTGRTHQIRVQFASRRHPLLGDGKYGSRLKGPIALQSARIAFAHPQTGEAMAFSIPPPSGWPWELFFPERSERPEEAAGQSGQTLPAREKP